MRIASAPTLRLGLAAVLLMAAVARGQSGACCHGDACVEAADAQSCAAYVCDVAALLPETFGGCYGDVDGNGYVNAGDRGFISAAIGLTDNDAICQFDLDGNGAINAADRGVVSAAIGQCLPLPDFQNGSGQSGGAADPRYPAPTFSAGLSCDEVDCGIQACAASEWDERFYLPGINGPVYAFAVFDDGTGPALYVGGNFTAASNVLATNIAKWDGIAWSPLIAGQVNGIGVSSSIVHALTVFDDGNGPALYAGGEFTTAGDVPASRIARWDGTAWSALLGPDGNGVSGGVSPRAVYSLAVFDDGAGTALYAGGNFETAGGIVVSDIAKWDGSSWSPLEGPERIGTAGSAGTSEIHALAVFDDGTGSALYAGGNFNKAGGLEANRIARWNGSAWSPLIGPSGNGVVSGQIEALVVHDEGTGPALYAGGSFSTAGGVAANRIAKWDGTAWSPLVGPNGNGMVNIGVRALAAFDDGTGPALYAGGTFTSAGGITLNRMAKWDGAAWSPLAGPSGEGASGDVEALVVFDDGTGPALLAGGEFTSAGGLTANRIAKWDGAAWSPTAGLQGRGVNGFVNAFATASDEDGTILYVGGEFRSAGDAVANFVAAWDGTDWAPMLGIGGAGLNGSVSALTVFDDGTGPSLYAGGFLSAADGIATNYVARWDGATWSPMPGLEGGASGTVHALAGFDDGTGPALYAAGRFHSASGVLVYGVAKWNGATWSPLVGPSGTGVGTSLSTVYDLAVYDDGSGPGLYAAGDFTTAGGISARRVAKWDGAFWEPLVGFTTNGTNDIVRALTVFDDGTGPALYAGGWFTTAGGVQVNRVARWDGVAWSALEGASGVGLDDQVYSLTVFDDGQGPALYVGGRFAAAGGVPAKRLAKWDGVNWSPVTPLKEIDGSGIVVLALVGFNDGTGSALYAGGNFKVAGPVPSSFIARWGCAP